MEGYNELLAQCLFIYSCPVQVWLSLSDHIKGICVRVLNDLNAIVLYLSHIELLLHPAKVFIGILCSQMCSGQMRPKCNLLVVCNVEIPIKYSLRLVQRTCPISISYLFILCTNIQV